MTEKPEDRLREIRKKYHEKNKEKINKKNREYYKKNREKVLARCRKYKKANREKIREREKLYRRLRTKNDLGFKVKYNIARRLRVLLKGCKSMRTIEFLGCNINYFRYQMACKFEDGMSWDNYGKWHLDHIKPCSSFDLTKLEEQKKCFHFTNYQPLWAEDNLKKSNKY